MKKLSIFFIGIMMSGLMMAKTVSETTPVQSYTSFTGNEIQMQEEMLSGIVTQKAGEWIIRTTSGKGEEKDFLPSNLTEDFKIEGLRVIFSGDIKKIPPDVRLIGSPIVLTAIKKAE